MSFKNSSQKGGVVLIILITLLLLVTFGLVVYFSPKILNLSLINPQNSSKTPPPTALSSPKITVKEEGLKWVLDSRFGYSLQYPSSWVTSSSREKLEGHERVVSLLSPETENNIPRAILYFYVWKKSFLNLDVTLETVKKTIFGKQEPEVYEMGGYKGYRMDQTTDEAFGTNIIFEKDGRIFHLLFSSTAKADEKQKYKIILEEIVKSFKFDSDASSVPLEGGIILD